MKRDEQQKKKKGKEEEILKREEIFFFSSRCIFAFSRTTLIFVIRNFLMYLIDSLRE